MSRSESHNLDQNQALSEEYERALAEYQRAIQAIEAAGDSVSAQQIESAIQARDRIHKVLDKNKSGLRRLLDMGARMSYYLLGWLLKLIQWVLSALEIIAAFLSIQPPEMWWKRNQVRKLDRSLKLNSRKIRRVVKSQRVVPLTNLLEVLDQPAQPRWLRLFKSNKPWHDRSTV